MNIDPLKPLIFSVRLSPGASVNAKTGYSARPFIDAAGRYRRGRIYTSASAQLFRRNVALAARAAMGTSGPFLGHVRVDLCIDESVDADNIWKNLLDALKGVAFGDDSRVKMSTVEVVPDTGGMAHMRVSPCTLRGLTDILEDWK